MELFFYVKSVVVCIKVKSSLVYNRISRYMPATFYFRVFSFCLVKLKTAATGPLLFWRLPLLFLSVFGRFEKYLKKVLDFSSN